LSATAPYVTYRTYRQSKQANTANIGVFMVISLTDPVFLRSSRYLLQRDLPPRPFHVLAGGGTYLRAIQILMFWSTMPDLPGPGVD